MNMSSITSFSNSALVFSETFRYLMASYQPGHDIEDLRVRWSQSLLDRLSTNFKVTGQPSDRDSVIFIGNHISYLDIVLLIRTVPSCSFVAKSIIKNWPLIGAAANRLKTVYVKRENKNSRTAARRAIKRALKKRQSYLSFPFWNNNNE